MVSFMGDGLLGSFCFLLACSKGSLKFGKRVFQGGLAADGLRSLRLLTQRVLGIAPGDTCPKHDGSSEYRPPTF